MALNPEPDGNSNGNGEEGSNRTFRTAAIALGGIGLLGVILIAVFMISSSGQRAQLLAQQQAANATNQAIAEAALSTATPPPTELPPAPTDTPQPPAPTATLPPTAAPATTVPKPVIVATTAVTTGTAASLASATPKAPSAPVAPASTAKPASTTTSSTSVKVTPLSSVTASGTLTNTATAANETPKTGSGDILVFVLAAGLIAVFVVARRLRTSQA